MSEVVVEGAVAARLIAAMRAYRKRTLTDCARAPWPFRIRMDGREVTGEVTGREGDYICRSPSGALYPVPASAFEAMYEEADPDGRE